jgi:hypothetical protein
MTWMDQMISISGHSFGGIQKGPREENEKGRGKGIELTSIRSDQSSKNVNCANDDVMEEMCGD